MNDLITFRQHRQLLSLFFCSNAAKQKKAGSNPGNKAIRAEMFIWLRCFFCSNSDLFSPQSYSQTGRVDNTACNIYYSHAPHHVCIGYNDSQWLSSEINQINLRCGWNLMSETVTHLVTVLHSCLPAFARLAQSLRDAPYFYRFKKNSNNQ